MTLLGELLHFGSGIAAIASPIAALQRTFLGKYVPLEVFRVNMTALTPVELCHYLTQLNPGRHIYMAEQVCSRDLGSKRFRTWLEQAAINCTLTGLCIKQALLSARATVPWP